MCRSVMDTIACGSKESDSPFPVSPRGKPGREGSPHAAAKPAAPPGVASPKYCPRQLQEHGDGGKEEFKDGRHVGLDFYDLLIEVL